MAYAENLMLQSPAYIFSIAFCMEHDACAFGLRRHVLYTLDCNTVLVCMFPRQTEAPLEGWQKGRLFIFIPEVCVSTCSQYLFCMMWMVVRCLELWFQNCHFVTQHTWTQKSLAYQGSPRNQYNSKTTVHSLWDYLSWQLQIVSNSLNSSAKWYF